MLLKTTLQVSPRSPCILIPLVAALSALLPAPAAQSQSLEGYVYDVITGQGVPNIEVGVGTSHVYTNPNGYYFFPLSVNEPPVRPTPPWAISPAPQFTLDPIIFNILGQKVGSLKQNQTLESFFHDNRYLAVGSYFVATFYYTALRRQPIVYMGSGNILFGKEIFESASVNNSLINHRNNDFKDSPGINDLDDFFDLTFRDENNPSITGDYFDIERDSFVVNGASQHNEEMVPTKIVKISNPLDTIAVNYNHFMTEIGVVQGYPETYIKNTWKVLSYDSVGVYIPPTPPQAQVDLHQAALNSIDGVMAVNGYNGWNTLIADLNKANNYPMFFIAPDCTYVVNNGGIYFMFIPNVPGGAGDNTTLRGPPSPLRRIRIDTDINNLLLAERACAHEEGHCMGYNHPSQTLYPWSIMVSVNTGQNLYIDPQTAAITAIQHNRVDSNYGIIKNK